jgi:hypothetical protein
MNWVLGREIREICEIEAEVNHGTHARERAARVAQRQLSAFMRPLISCFKSIDESRVLGLIVLMGTTFKAEEIFPVGPGCSLDCGCGSARDWGGSRAR